MTHSVRRLLPDSFVVVCLAVQVMLSEGGPDCCRGSQPSHYNPLGVTTGYFAHRLCAAWCLVPRHTWLGCFSWDLLPELMWVPWLRRDVCRVQASHLMLSWCCSDAAGLHASQSRCTVAETQWDSTLPNAS